MKLSRFLSHSLSHSLSRSSLVQPLSPRVTQGAAVLGIICCFAFYLGARFEATYVRYSQGSTEKVGDEVLFVTDTTTLKIASLGYRQAAADLMWLKSIQYFAQHLFTDRHYPWLKHFVQQIIDLDPQFRRVYMWAGGCILYGGLITPQDVRESNHIYQQALERFPNDYEPAYQLGMNYYFELKSPDPEQRKRDRERGLSYFERAAQMPNAPKSVFHLIQGIAMKMNRDDVLFMALNDELARAQDPALREQIQGRIKALSKRKHHDPSSSNSYESSFESMITGIVSTPQARELQRKMFERQRIEGRSYLKPLDYEIFFGQIQAQSATEVIPELPQASRYSLLPLSPALLD